MKRKVVALTMSAIMALSMAACGQGEAKTTAANTEAVKSTEAVTTGADTATEAGAETTEAEKTGSDLDLEGYAAIAAEGLETQIECEPIELSMACSGSVDGTIQGYAIESAIQAVSDWTGGNFKVTFYPGGQLGGDTELIEAVQMGSVDIYTGAPTSQVTLIPELAVLDIGGLYKDVDTCNKVLESFREQFNSYYGNVGLRLMTLSAPDFRELTSSKPIESKDDLQGLNIRVQENQYHMEFWSALGCNATPLAFSELYIALEQKMLDAQENPWGAIVGALLYETQPYIILSHHIPFVTTNVVNQSKYEAMSDGQKLALEQFLTYSERFLRAGTADDDARLMQITKGHGCTVTEARDDLRAAFTEASEAVIAKLKENLDPDFVDAYVAAARGN